MWNVSLLLALGWASFVVSAATATFEKNKQPHHPKELNPDDMVRRLVHGTLLSSNTFEAAEKAIDAKIRDL
ncbi:MAG: hypothetical protein MHM6MM_004036, partial [Cercozoa sp. M6MM]